MSTHRVPAPLNSRAHPSDETRRALRAKTVATRLTLEELREVEAAAERDPRRVAARASPAVGAAAASGSYRAAAGRALGDPIDSAESVSSDRAGEHGREAIVPRFRAQNPRPGQCPEAPNSRKAAP